MAHGQLTTPSSVSLHLCASLLRSHQPTWAPLPPPPILPKQVSAPTPPLLPYVNSTQPLGPPFLLRLSSTPSPRAAVTPPPLHHHHRSARLTAVLSDLPPTLLLHPSRSRPTKSSARSDPLIPLQLAVPLVKPTLPCALGSTKTMQPPTISSPATNSIIANKVPPSIIPLLTAARGLAIPKDEDGNLRPIAVGGVLLRFVASLALGLSHKETDAYFLGAHAKAKQFGIGVASGCNLMAAAIESHLRQNPTHIAIGADSRNAFNSYDRSVMWAIARTHFPHLECLLRLMYGASAPIFVPTDSTPAIISNEIGSRQGCSWGSFLYCLALEPVLNQLQQEFPSCFIVAYCDDVQIIGPPADAARALERYGILLHDILQQELRPDKTTVFAPSYSIATLRAAPHFLPSIIPDEKIHFDGIRVLGCPIGTTDFKVRFATDTASSIATDLATVGLCPSLHVQYVLTLKSLQHSITHLLRSIDGGAPCSIIILSR